MPIVEKVGREDLALYEIIRHPILCGEFYRNLDEPEWSDNDWEYTYYQREYLGDFNNYVSLCCGRAVGKTVALTDYIIWLLTNNLFDEYIVYTVPSKVHLEPVFFNLIKGFRNNNLLKHFIQPRRGINSSSYTITLMNSAQLVCRIAGQSGTGANVIGLHSPIVIVDEAGYYPWGTWMELQPVLNSWQEGHKLFVSGVPTGLRENNVLYYADEVDDSFSHHRTSAHENPRRTEEDERRDLKQYGGPSGEDYIHLVLGRHGSPVFAVFDRRLMKMESYPVYKTKINGIEENYSEIINKIALIPKIPENDLTILGVDLGYCYSANTEVLTNKGWIKHENLIGDEIVACFDTEREMIVWDKPNYLWSQDYSGKMISVTGKSVDFLVSPEHTVWINKYIESNPSKYEIAKAKDLINLENKLFNVRIAAPSDDVVGDKYFDVPYYYCDRKDREKKNIRVPMSVWVEFLGWFISEGSATNNKGWLVNLTQQESSYSRMIDEVLDKLPYNVTRKEFITKSGNKQIQWGINCKELCLWLRENCGVHSENKKIPDFVFDISTENQELFLQTLLLGGGSRINSSRSPQYNSQSELLIDQVQRLAISLGYSSTKGQYKEMFRCSIMDRQENTISRDNVKEIDYNGKIYCLNTNQGFYVTRRNGKVSIQGNTEPTAIVVLYEKDGEMRTHARIEMVKVKYDMQEKILDYIDTKFEHPELIGIDVGAEQGLYHHLVNDEKYLHKNYKKRINPVKFGAWLKLGETVDGEEIKQKIKPYSVSLLQEYSNSHKIIYSSTDLELVIEMERMTYTKTPKGDITYRTLTPKGGKRGEDHFTSAMLCAAVTYALMIEGKLFSMSRPTLAGARWVRG